MVTPEGGATSASRQTYITGNAVKRAAAEAKEVAIEEAAVMLGKEPGTVAFVGGLVYDGGSATSVTVADVIASCRKKGKLTLGKGWFNPETTSLDPQTGQGVPFGTYAFATQVAEVEVDTDTGKVEVLRLTAAHDVGKAINPQLVEGQIEGGSVMGLGYGLLEEVTTVKGDIKNNNFTDYLLPTTLDVPEITAIIVEDREPTGPFGAKGVGEPALIPTAAAIANAVYDAIGVRIYSLPITPEKVLDALARAQADR
jgi:nicotinate dehydrogenase medium molybdopterin subunit